REREPRMYALLDRLALLAELPAPRLAIADAGPPNAFAVGTSPRRSVVAITGGLQATLTARELEAVLAHELAHVANRDAVVMTAASVPRTLGTLLIAGEGVF